ncbi:MAG TPA: tetratricopeptide repeat protein [Terracidiphilus sp.]|jgi:hypothetical protein
MKTFTWKEAFDDAHEGAMLNNPPYQCFVGYCYSEGRGVKQDHKKAAYWFKRAAANGNKDGMFNYALISELGEGTRRNAARALRLYIQAANAGHLQAQSNLAVRYLEGRGSRRNLDEGIRWLRKAAKRGDDVAQYNLGRAYLVGDGGITKNIRLARTWLKRAAKNNYRPARLLIKKLKKATL